MRRARWSLAALVALTASESWAQPSKAPPPLLEARRSSAVAHGAGQQPLAVEVRDGKLLAGTCAQAPCAGAEAIEVPARFRSGLDHARFEVITIAQRRAVIEVIVPDLDAAQTWVALLAAPLSPGPVKTLFADVADVTGSPLVTEPSLVQRVDDQLAVGGRSASVHLCGRPTVFGPRVVDPADMTLKPAPTWQRLSAAERKGAIALKATRVEGTMPGPPLARWLHSVGASSAVGSPASLTDGNPETTWGENRAGDGRGEFAVMRAAREVPLTGVTLTVRPARGVVEHGASPHHVFLADDQGIFAVTLPEDAWQHPGSSYRVSFASPRTTSCLALVLDDAFVPRGEAAPAVTVAEVEAQTALDGTRTLDELAAQLGSNDETLARQARAALERGGEPARRAVEKAYGQLDEAGRMRALDVIDQATCREAAPTYVRVLGSRFESEARHGRTRVERCRRDAFEALSAAVLDPAHPSRQAAATTFALIGPAEALPVLLQTDLTPGPKGLRGALVRAASAPRAREALAHALDDAQMPPRRTLDLLRAAGDAVGDPVVRPSAGRALDRAAPAGAGFDERYLALGPAARLAAAGDDTARARIGAALADQTPALRAAAAGVAVAPALRPGLLGASGDAEPRVREASARALGHAVPSGPDERTALLRLSTDEWTFVRVAAYDSLGALPADVSVDKALVDRLDADRSPLALARAIEAVGQRHVVSAAPQLRRMVDDKARPIDVRARSAQALGSICDQASLERLSALARAGADPMAEGDAQSLGGSALLALGRLHPPDLEARLAPLLSSKAPRVIALAARAALANPDRCR